MATTTTKPKTTTTKTDSSKTTVNTDKGTIIINITNTATGGNVSNSGNSTNTIYSPAPATTTTTTTTTTKKKKTTTTTKKKPTAPKPTPPKPAPPKPAPPKPPTPTTPTPTKTKKGCLGKTLVALGIAGAMALTFVAGRCSSEDKDTVADVTTDISSSITTTAPDYTTQAPSTSATTNKPTTQKPQTSASTTTQAPKAEYVIYEDVSYDFDHMAVGDASTSPTNLTVHNVSGKNAYSKNIDDPSTKYLTAECGTHTLTGDNVAMSMDDSKYLEAKRYFLCKKCFNKQGEIKHFENCNPGVAYTMGE